MEITYQVKYLTPQNFPMSADFKTKNDAVFYARRCLLPTNKIIGVYAVGVIDYQNEPIIDATQQVILAAKWPMIKERMDNGREFMRICDDKDIYLTNEESDYVYRKYVLGWLV